MIERTGVRVKPDGTIPREYTVATNATVAAATVTRFQVMRPQTREPRGPPGSRPRDVHHADPYAADLDDVFLRQLRLQDAVVQVPVDRLDRRTQPAQLIEHRRCDEVAAVEDHIRRAAQCDATFGS